VRLSRWERWAASRSDDGEGHNIIANDEQPELPGHVSRIHRKGVELFDGFGYVWTGRGIFLIQGQGSVGLTDSGDGKTRGSQHGATARRRRIVWSVRLMRLRPRGPIYQWRVSKTRSFLQYRHLTPGRYRLTTNLDIKPGKTMRRCLWLWTGQDHDRPVELRWFRHAAT